MQIVILAWWLGTRLRPITETISKPMVEVDNKPFLFYQIDMLRSYWFTDILILAWYLGHMIQEYFWDGSSFGVKITYSYEKDQLLWTGWALKLAEDKLENEFILINGDSYLWFDYNNLISAFHKKSDTTLVSIYLKKNPLSAMFTVYNNEKSESNVKSNILLNNWIIEKYEKWTKDPEFHYVDAWVILIKKAILEDVPSWVVLSLESDILQKQIIDKKVWYYETDQMFYDIWTFDRLSIFKNAFGS